MKITILNQGIGVVDTPLPERVTNPLRIEIEGADGEVVKLVGEEHVVYAKVDGDAAVFDASALRGRVALSLVRASGTVPLGAYICLPCEGGVDMYPDAANMLKRLARVERDISDALAVHRAMDAKYDGLVKRIEALFSGYNF